MTYGTEKEFTNLKNIRYQGEGRGYFYEHCFIFVNKYEDATNSRTITDVKALNS
jgi:hypothetical protein